MERKRYKVKGAAEPDTLERHILKESESNYSGNGFVIIGASPEELDDLSLIENIRRHNQHTPIIMIAGETSEKHMAAALEIGLSDFIGLPLEAQSIMARLKKYRSPVTPVMDVEADPCDSFIIGQSPAMKMIKSYLDKIAATESNVLITGETGTGKDMAAEYIHAKSGRRAHPLVCVNCTAFPETLLESELFGYEKGAFTNAISSRAGKFEMASGSTLFLDEIGDMGLNAQAKILRAIEKKEIWRIGGDRPVHSDFRLITATNRDLETLIGHGKFRDDLYYRLNIARVHIPPLRERKEDIDILAQFAIRKYNRKFGMSIHGIRPDVMDMFMSFDWPGNVRQLNNIVEASFINIPGDELRVQDLPEVFRRDMLKNEKPHRGEVHRIHEALRNSGMNKTRAAKELNISRMTLYRKMVRYNIPRE